MLDLAIVLGSYALALTLKFDGRVPNESWNQLLWAGPLIAFAYILAYQSFGVYRTAWQYGSVRDALLLAIAVGVVTAGILIVNVMLPKRPIPLTVNVISAAFIFLFHAMARMLPRLWNASGLTATLEGPLQRVLIIGAGDTGQLLAWELQHNRGQPYRAAAFVDDDAGLRGKRVHGIAVLGNRYDIPSIIEKQRISLVAIALPPAHIAGLPEILALVEPSKIPVRIVPGLQEIMEGRAHRGEMREITMEDLLARESVGVDEDACRRMIEGRVVLITGAAGSIGSELSRRVAALNPAALHLLDINETGLYELRNELRPKLKDPSLVHRHRLIERRVDFAEADGQIFLAPAATGDTGLRCVISPRRDAPAAPGLISHLYEVTNLVAEWEPAAARYAALFDLAADRFCPIASPEYGYRGTLTMFDPRDRLDRIEVITPYDVAKTMGRFMAKRGPGLYMCFAEAPDLGAIRDRLQEHAPSDWTGSTHATVPDTLFIHPKALAGLMMGVSRTTVGWTWSGHPERVQPAPERST